MESIPLQQIRAVYDEQTIRVYQAYSDHIADAALGAGTLASPQPESGMSKEAREPKKAVRPVRVQWDPERRRWPTKSMH